MPPNYTNSALNRDFTGTLQASGGACAGLDLPGFSLAPQGQLLQAGRQACAVLPGLAPLQAQVEPSD